MTSNSGNHLQLNQPVRIPSLDGLRGLAILLVLLFHTYARWPDSIPWVTTHRDVYLFKYGHLGVELFFLISGFVIYMTLEKCQSLREFMFRRWLRLFPAMLLASLLIYSSSFLLDERPTGNFQIYDLLPGLLFVDHGLMNKIQGFVSLQSIEGAFWSLYVEVKFYFIFGSLYFYNKRTALRCLIALFLVAFVYEAAGKFSPSFQFKPITGVLFNFLSLKYFGWFCVGALLYKAHVLKSKKLALASAMLMIPTVLIMYERETTILAVCALVYAVFYLALNSKFVGSVFASRVFVFLGFVSYPFYLIHENTMVALTIKTREQWAWIPDHMTPWPGIAMLLLISYCIAKYLEPTVRRILKERISIIPTRWLRVVFQTHRTPRDSPL